MTGPQQQPEAAAGDVQPQTHSKLPVDAPMVGVRLMPRKAAPGTPHADRARWLVQLGETRTRQKAEMQAVTAAAQAIQDAVQSLDAAVGQRLDEIAGLVVELGLTVAREIVGNAIENGAVDPTPTVIRCLRDAVYGASDAGLIVHLHPDDLGAVLDRLAREPGLQELVAATKFQPDPQLGRGAVRADTSAGRLRYEPAQAFERVASAVRSAAAGGAP